MKLSKLIKTKYGTVRAFLEVNKHWTEPSTRTLMSRGAEVAELAKGGYVLLNKQTKFIASLTSGKQLDKQKHSG